MNGLIRIGCSGYAYPHWRGNFYPPGWPERQYLEFYASRFDSVELNVTFYRLPSAAVFRRWAARTPEDFTFILKGSRFITHRKRLDCGRDAVVRFMRAAAPLDHKWRGVLWQLPPDLAPDPTRLDRFLSWLAPFGQVRHFFEFRHPGWLTAPIQQRLADCGAGLCGSDWPGAPCAECWCGAAVYFRRHGPGGAYGGSYSWRQRQRDAELLRAHAVAGREVFIYFNNDLDGMAPVDAAAVKRYLTPGR
ncbi:MAG: DUF72 domain-containing protein [Victivallales bacterium]|nr:DUF72 domain-containing protein [Victivallales bacterium]